MKVEANVQAVSNSAKTSSAGVVFMCPVRKAASRSSASAAQSSSIEGSGQSRLESSSSANVARSAGGNARTLFNGSKAPSDMLLPFEPQGSVSGSKRFQYEM